MLYTDNPRVAALTTKGMPLSDHAPQKKAGAEFRREDIPALVRMATDMELFFNDESEGTWAAPIHAWRALGQLRAPQGVAPLIEVLRFPWEEDDELDEWRNDEIPAVLAQIGEAALEPTGALLHDRSQPMWGRISAAKGVSGIGKNYPNLRDRCVALLTEVLGTYANGKVLNGAVIGNLLDLNAVESLEIIREAYSRGKVDPAVSGDIEDVEIELGVRTERSTTRRNFFRAANPDAAGIADLRAELKEQENQGIVRASSPARHEGRKVGRNDPCPCGSGQKYKKCCLNAKTAQ